MKRILVVYGTTEGQTAKVAEFVGATLRGLNADVDVVNAAIAGPDRNPAFYDATIVAASMHAGGFQRSVRHWIARHHMALDLKPTAFLAVCLGILEHNPKTDQNLADITERLFETSGWRPTELKFVAGALPYTKYNFLKRWVMRRIVERAHGDTDTSRDFEYTNWQDLRGFAQKFFFEHSFPMALAV